MVLIPTAEEELELIVKCHREEFHDDNGGGYTFMRDMLTNNCHITNFIKKIDYIQSICKQCKAGASLDEGDLLLPGKDLSIEMINMRRATQVVPSDFEVVFIMDNFSSFFSIQIFEEKIVKKGKYYIYNRVFCHSKPSGCFHMRVEQMGQCINKALGDHNIAYKIGTAEHFDRRLDFFVSETERVFRLAQQKGYHIDLKQELYQMVTMAN